MNNVTFASSSNELQLLEFLVGVEAYGINIAKVSEIIRCAELTPVPSSPEQIEGVFMHRDKLVTVINLHKVLGFDLPEECGGGLFIVCDFEKLSIAFHVSAVEGISKLSWDAIEKTPSVSGSNDDIPTGIAKNGDHMVMILDCEKIICDLNYGHDFDVGNVEELRVSATGVDFNQGLVVAEDSSFLCKVLVDALKKAGFKNIKPFANGADALDYIETLKTSTNLKKDLAAVITDIEMPKMDGLTLTSRIKNDKMLRNTPVYIFSSLIHENVRLRGDGAGATAQFSRAQLPELLERLFEDLK